MRLLELFCGTKSFGKVFEKHNWEVISLDIDEKRDPDICADILDWDYTIFDKKYFNHIHLSPPCIYMSQVQQSWYGRYKGTGENKYLFTKEIHLEHLKESDKILYKIKEILDYFEDITFTIENPYHTKFNNITKRNILNYDFSVADYCMYNHQIKKPTVFLNNFNLKFKRCDRSHKHVPYKIFCGGRTTPKDNVYRIPEKLVEAILLQITENKS